jgi:secreted PhoX family phosphatase
MKRIAIALTLTTMTVPGAAAAAGDDFGATREAQLRAHSEQLFGVVQPVAASSTESIDAATANANPTALVTVAKGLSVKVVAASADLGANTDMMAPWPDDVNPTHLIVCNEQGTASPGVQRIRLSDGLVETILTGTSSCDPAHRTAWGTVIVAEEAGSSGWMLEIANPLNTTDVLFDRGAGIASGGIGAENVVTRPAVGRTSFEGVALYDSGVMYYGDENRPFQGTPGGAYFKFVPIHPWIGGPAITDLDDSPLAEGSVYGLRLGKRSGNTDYGQGTSAGLGTWVEITPSVNANLRAAAAELALTGYYRPEDAQIDLRAAADGFVRFCANNTGNEGSDQYFGETICVTDGTLEEAVANTATPEVQNFIIGTPDLAMMDNLAYQPGRGNWLLQEDGDGPDEGRNNDIFACLKDGADADLLSDGCIRILTTNDLSAETTGGLFDGPGDRYWVSVQHNVTGHGVVLEITGWK